MTKISFIRIETQNNSKSIFPLKMVIRLEKDLASMSLHSDVSANVNVPYEFDTNSSIVVSDLNVVERPGLVEKTFNVFCELFDNYGFFETGIKEIFDGKPHKGFADFDEAGFVIVAFFSDGTEQSIIRIGTFKENGFEKQALYLQKVFNLFKSVEVFS